MISRAIHYRGVDINKLSKSEKKFAQKMKEQFKLKNRRSAQQAETMIERINRRYAEVAAEIEAKKG
jgi:hypothetical protein